MSAVVLLNGASASGKSRLVAGVQRIAAEAGVLQGVRVAQRSTTRRARERESLPTENRHLKPKEFEKAVASGELDVHWRRAISPEHEIRYGFSLGAELGAGGIVILSTNNYLDWPKQPLLSALRHGRQLMVVRVFASDQTRFARLAARRPPLSPTELASRMADVRSATLPPADHLVPNDTEFQALAEWEFLRLLAAFRFATAPEPGAPMAVSGGVV